MKAPTRFIANDRGHLVEAQDRIPGNNPFGHFHGNWEEPCHNPGNHVENTVNRSTAGANCLRKEKHLYDAVIHEEESKHDFVSAQRVKKDLINLENSRLQHVYLPRFC